MNIDEAINKAADHIERYPQSYDFGQGTVLDRDFFPNYVKPGPGGWGACMLSRIGEMAGMAAGTGHRYVAEELLGMTAETFYNYIRAATPYARGRDEPLRNTATIPTAMRTVAKQFTGIPISVRRIFAAPVPQFVSDTETVPF